MDLQISNLNPPSMAAASTDASLLPRRIVKETQRLLSEPGPHPVPAQMACYACPVLTCGPPHQYERSPPVLSAPGISATPYQDNLRYFNVIMAGPAQSAYESARSASPTATSAAASLYLPAWEFSCIFLDTYLPPHCHARRGFLVSADGCSQKSSSSSHPI